MRIVATAGAALLIATTLSYAQDPKVKRGQTLYADNKCRMCHAIAGTGNAKGPLDDVGTKLSAEEIRQWLINPAEMSGKTKSARKPPMPSYAKLPKDDVDALVAYMLTVKKKS
jgi:mono/diheme cytochrome c family protein